MDIESEIAARKQQLEVMRSAWPFLLPLFESMKADQVQSLIAQESEQVRGQIKALTQVIELPQTVLSELSGMEQQKADLPE